MKIAVDFGAAVVAAVVAAADVVAADVVEADSVSTKWRQSVVKPKQCRNWFTNHSTL